MRKMEAGEPTWFEYIKSTLSAGQTVGIDFKQYPAGALKARSDYFAKSDITVKRVDNLVNAVWTELDQEKPTRPPNPVTVLDVKYCGMSSLEKQALINDKLKDESFNFLVMSTLDDICWITNLRGTDIPFNPVFFAYATFTPNSAEKVTLYLDESKVAGIQDYLVSQNIRVQPYSQIFDVMDQAESNG